ncbi:[protein-PII] uridylyltransferase [Thermomonas brevis]|uniref:Bifunctional uridylyltransferase/uridylyl-removing enzyme n=1 Tax=Thermomonas brevis TaxID=215691 RepID=A0A7G9QVB9_9GAMM|nr:[protein-PII] uridylyltransferase [Thermomonas brevis]QNN47294.1 [protein-PII] uridylyltransferase [Thermomonas brevis]
MSAQAGDDPAWSAAAKAALAQADARLARRFDAGARADRLIALRARAVDVQVRAAWRRCIPADAPLALFAVGGYGRGELFPQSDVDLLVLAEPDAQQTWQAALARFIALLWDAGLQASHAVRSAGECTEAAADQSVLTALIEARPLAAGEDEAARLAEVLSPQKVWPPEDFYEAKLEEQRLRHARFGDTSDNLEPNLKDGPGGLRDLHLLGWLALRSLGVHTLDKLIELGRLGWDEAAALERERRALCRLRYGLHLVAGRREERLRFDYQKLLAARLGYADDADSLGVEKMMQGFYRSAAVVRRIGDRLLQRFEEHFEGVAAPEPIDAEFERRSGYLAARVPGWLGSDPAHIFALFAAWAVDPSLRGLHSQTARELAQELPQIPAYTDASPALREAFMQLLRGPQPVQTLERMARAGVLGRWIPAFQRVSGRMQFDLFHVFTVDQHTLAVLRNLAGFASGEPDPRFSIAHQVWPSLRKPELLLLAGLFHDIGKGRGGDHSELGAVDARAFCEAMGLSEADTALVEWLVRRHLLMSVTAQKQDITDPEVIHRFAGEVADRQRLDHLYLLTCADIAGTSPKLWNSWKDRLLADLHTATRLALRRGLGQPVAADERIAENREAARALLLASGHDDAAIDALFARMPAENFLRSRPDQIAWQAAALRDARAGEPVVASRAMAGRDGRDGLDVLVHMPDQDGLFAAIVIALDRLGMSVLQARVLDGPDGTIFDTFHVLPAEQRQAPEPALLAASLARALGGDLSRMLPARRSQPQHLRHFRVAPQLDFAEIAGGTRIGLICTDRPGLLADVARVLREQHLRVHDARIATFGERAEDLLLVSDEHNHPLAPDRCDALRAALLAALDGDKR